MSRRGITLYLQVHQPYRVRPYSVFDTANRHDYFDGRSRDAEWDNQAMFEKVAETSYRPMNQLLELLLSRHPEFQFSLSLTGTFVEQARQWAPDVLDSFKRLVATGRVDILAESYHHSLAFFYSVNEFERQVKLHQDLMEAEFGVTPRVVRGTELAYNDSFAEWAESRGYHGVLAEGWDPVLEWRSPNLVHRAAGTSLPLLLKNYRLSDDIAFRFSDQSWQGWPVTANKFADWVNRSLGDEQTVNLFMDYETFGEHQWQGTGIFDFFADFVGQWLQSGEREFYTVSRLVAHHQPAGELSVPRTTTWADSGRDLSAWSGNSMQKSALRYIYALEDDVLRTEDEQLISDWRRLQTSDHFYYMCTKGFADGEVHAYFSPYQSPYDAFLYYLNAVRDIRWRLFVSKNQRRING